MVRVATRALSLWLEARTGQRPQPPLPGFLPSPVPWTPAERADWRRACSGHWVGVAGPFAIADDGAGAPVLALGERLPPAADPEGSGWIDLVGRYRMRRSGDEVSMLEGDGDVRVSERHGRLHLEFRTHPAFGTANVTALLQVASPDRARVVGPWADMGPVLTVDRHDPGAPVVRLSGLVFDRVGD